MKNFKTTIMMCVHNDKQIQCGVVSLSGQKVTVVFPDDATMCEINEGYHETLNDALYELNTYCPFGYRRNAIMENDIVLEVPQRWIGENLIDIIIANMKIISSDVMDETVCRYLDGTPIKTIRHIVEYKNTPFEFITEVNEFSNTELKRELARRIINTTF